MPSIATLVADLAAGNVTHMGSRPRDYESSLESVISAGRKLKHNFVHMKAALNGAKLNMPGAATDFTFNGVYVHYEDGWATAGNMDINRRLLASGNFSGCAYKVYRTAPATYKCVHIARPGGVNSDALVTSVAQHAASAGWTELQSVSTAGLIGGGCIEVIIVTQLFLNQKIDTVRLKIGVGGSIVGKDTFTSGV